MIELRHLNAFLRQFRTAHSLDETNQGGVHPPTLSCNSLAETLTHRLKGAKFMCGGTEKPCGSSVLNKWGWEQRGLEEMDVVEPFFLVLGDIVLWWRWRNIPHSLPGVHGAGVSYPGVLYFRSWWSYRSDSACFWRFLELQVNITLLLFGVVFTCFLGLCLFELPKWRKLTKLSAKGLRMIKFAFGVVCGALRISWSG